MHVSCCTFVLLLRTVPTVPVSGSVSVPGPRCNSYRCRLQIPPIFGSVTLPTLRAQRLKKINFDWKFQSRLKISISIEIFNPDLQNSPQKIGVCWVARLKFSISIENFNPKGRSWIFSIFGPLGKFSDKGLCVSRKQCLACRASRQNDRLKILGIFWDAGNFYRCRLQILGDLRALLKGGNGKGGIRICWPVHCLSARSDRQPYCHTNATSSPCWRTTKLCVTIACRVVTGEHWTGSPNQSTDQIGKSCTGVSRALRARNPQKVWKKSPQGPRKSGKSLEQTFSRPFPDFFGTFSRLCGAPRPEAPGDIQRARETPVARRRARKGWGFKMIPQPSRPKGPGRTKNATG